MLIVWEAVFLLDNRLIGCPIWSHIWVSRTERAIERSEGGAKAKRGRSIDLSPLGLSLVIATLFFQRLSDRWKGREGGRPPPGRQRMSLTVVWGKDRYHLELDEVGRRDAEEVVSPLTRVTLKMFKEWCRDKTGVPMAGMRM